MLYFCVEENIFYAVSLQPAEIYMCFFMNLQKQEAGKEQQNKYLLL